MKTVSQREVPINCEDDVITARRAAQALAQRLGFDSFATAAVTTATSELSRNIYRHAGRGVVRLYEIQGDGRDGVRIEFTDAGPGIRDMRRALQGGYSTAGSLGLGLSGSQRLVDSFDIESNPDAPSGTRIVVVKWRRF